MLKVFRSTRVLSSIVLIATQALFQSNALGNLSDSFIEYSGVVAFEAAQYSRTTTGSSGDRWTTHTQGGENGLPGLKAGPDNGTFSHPGSGSPVLEFDIYFQTTGVYTAYIRGSGPIRSSDSIHLGIDDILITEPTGFGLNNYPSTWTWKSQRGQPLQDASFEVSSPGLHTFKIWMREDGVAVDDVVISQISGLTPEALDNTPYSFRYHKKPPNTPPLASNDVIAVVEDGPAVMVDVLANDLDGDNDVLTVIDLGFAEYGSVSLVEGLVVYTLNNGHVALETLEDGVLLFDAFDYLLSDGRGGEDTGNVSVSIMGVTETAAPDSITTNGYTKLDLTLSYDPALDGSVGEAFAYEVVPSLTDESLAHVMLRVSHSLAESIANGVDRAFPIELTSATIPPSDPVTELPEVPVSFPPDFVFEMEITDIGYQHAKLTWNDDSKWSHPWLIQRSRTANFQNPIQLKNNQTADNTGEGTFRWLGVNADNYVDLDGLSEGTTYYYRVASCRNLDEHYQQGAVPEFSNWKYGTCTTGTLEAGKKQIFDVTQYGAVANDGRNDYLAVLSALADAESAGGGTVYIPSGYYDLWPVDPAVNIVNGMPTLRVGERAIDDMFQIKSDNITFLGDTAGANPTTFLKFYLWGKQPATKYLSIRNAMGTEVGVRRYSLFKPRNVQNITIKNLDIDMGAPPVNSGKRWYSLDERKFQWDISHKFFHSNHGAHFKNAIIENVVCKNGRGELIYNGGNSGKILISKCTLGPSNRSTISGSFDAEIVDTVIRDSANSAVESAIFSNVVSVIDGQVYNQNHIARGCTFIGLDQSGKGVMKRTPGAKAFLGWACFNQEGTYQSVTDTSFTDFVTASFAPWYEYRNGFRFNCVFNEIPGNLAGSIIRTWTSKKSSYKLDGGMSEILWLGDTIHVAKNWPNHQTFFYSQPGAAAAGNESPWIWKAVHFENTGAPHQINRLWIDIWSLSSGRQEAVFEDWTTSENVRFDSLKFQFLSPNHIDPAYINFLE